MRERSLGGVVVAGRWFYWRHCNRLRCLSRRRECNQVCNAITQMKTATTTGQNNNKVSSKKQTIKATTSAVTSSLFSKLLLLVLGKPLKIGEP